MQSDRYACESDEVEIPGGADLHHQFIEYVSWCGVMTRSEEVVFRKYISP